MSCRTSLFSVPCMVLLMLPCATEFAHAQIAVRSINGKSGRVTVQGSVDKGDSIVVLERTDIMSGTRVLGTVDDGTELVAEDVRGDWVSVTAKQAGDTITGWIQREHVGRLFTIPADGKWHSPFAASAEAGQTDSETKPDETDITKQVMAWQQNADRWHGIESDPFLRQVDPEWQHEFDSVTSTYSIQKSEDGYTASNAIPDKRGNFRVGKGALRRLPVLAPNAPQATMELVLKGKVWTPRVQTAGGVSLDGDGKIIERPGFDFEQFKRSTDVIPVANGYAVNLFGAEIKEGLIGGPAPRRSYLGDNGERLYGRLIRVKSVARGGVTREVLDEVVVDSTTLPGKHGAF